LVCLVNRSKTIGYAETTTLREPVRPRIQGRVQADQEKVRTFSRPLSGPNAMIQVPSDETSRIHEVQNRPSYRSRLQGKDKGRIPSLDYLQSQANEFSPDAPQRGASFIRRDFGLLLSCFSEYTLVTPRSPLGRHPLLGRSSPYRLRLNQPHSIRPAFKAPPLSAARKLFR